jgi:hypothetical protein
MYLLKLLNIDITFESILITENVDWVARNIAEHPTTCPKQIQQCMQLGETWHYGEMMYTSLSDYEVILFIFNV